MVKKKSKSPLSSKMGTKANAAFKKSRGKPVEYTGQLPAGIEDGVAKLEKVEFAEDKKGVLYFRAEGVIVKPLEHEGERVAGRTTSIFETMGSTPNRARKTFQDHFDWALNELKKLGLDAEEFDSVDEMEESMQEALAGTYFKFRTWKGEPSKEFPNPRTNHDWRGALEDYEEEEEEEDEEVVDETEEGEPEEEEEEETEEEEGEDESEEGEDEPEEEEDEEPEEDEEEEGDEEGEDDETEEEEEEEPEPPAKGEDYWYKPPKKRKPLAVTVTAVFVKRQTVTVKAHETGVSYKGVPWDSLMDEE